MVDVDCAVGATPCLAAADDSDYEIDQVEVIFWGHCPTCRKAVNDARVLERARLKAHNL